MAKFSDQIKKVSRNKKILSAGGFSLMEMLVTLTIIAFVSIVAVPGFQSLNQIFDHMNARSYLMQDLKRGQAEAITQGCRGVFVVAANGRSYTFGCDYLTYDVNDPPSHDVISLQRNLPAHIIISVPSPIIFNSRGQAVDINDIVSNLTISLQDTSTGASVEFANGTLLGTGVFSFN